MKKKKQDFTLPACSCMTLTSKEGKHFWFRTCDIEAGIWKAGAHVVRFGRESRIDYGDGKQEIGLYAFIGITYNFSDTWLLDGINECGLCGGLLMLYEGTSVEQAQTGKTGYIGMELVTKILSSCKDVKEVIALAKTIQILDIPFEGNRVPATMHYFFADSQGEEVILEAACQEQRGILQIYTKEEIIGVMTNSPAYDRQLKNLSWFLSKSPELKQGKNKTSIEELDFNGRKIKADEKADHISLSGVFPASYASHDRFLRLAVIKALNKSGNLFTGEEMLALGSGMMNVVMEPDTGGLFHYTHMDDEGRIVGQKAGFTQYLVMYDLEKKCFYMKVYDMVSWIKYEIKNTTAGEKEILEIPHHHMQGVIVEDGNKKTHQTKI